MPNIKSDLMLSLCRELENLRDVHTRLALCLRDIQFELAQSDPGAAADDFETMLKRLGVGGVPAVDAQQAAAVDARSVAQLVAPDAPQFTYLGNQVFDCNNHFATTGWGGASGASQVEGARRIAACLEACKGIDTESLETDGVASMKMLVDLGRKG